MSFNVPDDWGCYYSRCARCHGTNHASGVEVCGCEQEAEELLEEVSRLMLAAADSVESRRWEQAATQTEALACAMRDLADCQAGRARN